MPTAKAFGYFTPKGEVDLSSKEICDLGVRIMARELTENAEVTALVLNNNEIGHEGGAEIAEALYFHLFLVVN
jgi:Ran GTPase-activating protein (RanGAP) involved in mRNA processing and transport